MNLFDDSTVAALAISVIVGAVLLVVVSGLVRLAKSNFLAGYRQGIFGFVLAGAGSSLFMAAVSRPSYDDSYPVYPDYSSSDTTNAMRQKDYEAKVALFRERHKDRVITDPPPRAVPYWLWPAGLFIGLGGCLLAVPPLVRVAKKLNDE